MIPKFPSKLLNWFTYITVFITWQQYEAKWQNSLSQPFHENDAGNVPFLRTFSFAHSWLDDKWARRTEYILQCQYMPKTWKQGAVGTLMRSSLWLPEETENSGCHQWVHRYNKLKRGSSVKKKKEDVKVDKIEMSRT